ncbi:hypothetical protein [Moraxella bovis]|uniref:TreTu toxin C-terminal domain-containing protein n=1 Tax=Moraxella bovis TaxID=476 RepID=A0A378PP14_MORBO|nr:hypothetical protein [Moraxella bovis]STY88575.1 Uncharacterised protein [Moraxella bovis]
MFIKHPLLSLLILCITTLAYGKDTKADNAHYTNDGSNTAIITNTLADIDNLSGLSPLDVIKNPNLLDDKWDLKPIPLSTYTEEEKQLQQLINNKTTTAVKTYSTPEQSKEWTKYDHEEITPYTWKIVELALTEANGKTFNVTLLRPNWWILNIGADRKGNRFYLKIPEVAEGSALVTNIRTNQLDTRLWNEQRNGDYVYRPITATFEHESSQVLNLYFANNKEPVGRWMSNDELQKMQSTNQIVEGAGGQTFISINGADDFRKQALNGSVYVEFNIPKKSLLQGGKDGWYKMLGPNASKSQQFLLNKQGGEILPYVSDIQIIDRK